MSRERRFTPMPEAQTPRLRTDVALPLHIEESIGLNVGRIQTLCQLSGFRHLRIENQKNSETSKAEPTIVGMTGRGEALAGKISTRTIPTYEYQSHALLDDSRNALFFKQTNWHDLTIDLNPREMSRRILDSKRNIRQVEFWATEVDKALKRGIVKGGIRQLIINLKPLEILPICLYYANNLVSFVYSNNFVQLGTSFVIDMLIWNSFGILSRGVERFKEGSGSRLSLFINFELDRALALLVLAHTQKLAKDIS